MFEYVKEYLKINDVEYKEELLLKSISPIRIGGRARLVVYPDGEEKIVSLVAFLTEIGCGYRIFGKMSNVLPPDEDIDTVIIRTDRMCSVRLENGELYAQSGAPIPRVASIAAISGLGGFEELSGIPGTVGGAVVGNAGAFGREISDLFLCGRCYFPEYRAVEQILPSDLNFKYRHSNLKKINCLVLSCRFKLFSSTSSELEEKKSYFAAVRRASQPTTLPSLGSTFKRPNSALSAGAMIDQCGLKGFAVGDAMISEKHAGFIVNFGEASAADYIAVAEAAEREVYKRFGVKLEKEIEILN